MGNNRRYPRTALGVLLLSLGLAVLVTPIRADDEHEKRARAAVAAGAVVPLERLLAEVRSRFDGRILTVELEEEERDEPSGWFYEVRLLTPKGSVLELVYQARDLRLVETLGRRDQGAAEEDD